jgi:rhamnogalacturonyl hydrolase YesR
MLVQTFVALTAFYLPRAFALDIPYSQWAANSAIVREQGNGTDSSGTPVVSYEHGEFWWGLRNLFEKTGNSTYFDYILNSAERDVDEEGTIAPSGYK